MEQEQASKAHSLLHKIYTQVPIVLVGCVILIASVAVVTACLDDLRGTTEAVENAANNKFKGLSTKASSSKHMKLAVELCITTQQPLYIKISPIKDKALHFKNYGEEEINKEATNVLDSCLKNYVESGLTIDDYESRAVAVKALRSHMIT
tara:strand:- start:183 stop:632 length:450 start_codon:yes stop_codon:yes gene_type:complete